jgi:hypothetical protein
MAMATVQQHFTKADPVVFATYRKLLATARTFGPVDEDPKKTSIHLVRRSAFAGVATRRTSLVLTVKSASDIASPRVTRREQASAGRWHLQIRLEAPAQVDRELTAWLKAAYALGA